MLPKEAVDALYEQERQALLHDLESSRVRMVMQHGKFDKVMKWTVTQLKGLRKQLQQQHEDIEKLQIQHQKDVTQCRELNVMLETAFDQHQEHFQTIALLRDKLRSKHQKLTFSHRQNSTPRTESDTLRHTMEGTIEKQRFEILALETKYATEKAMQDAQIDDLMQSCIAYEKDIEFWKEEAMHCKRQVNFDEEELVQRRTLKELETSDYESTKQEYRTLQEEKKKLETDLRNLSSKHAILQKQLERSAKNSTFTQTTSPSKTTLLHKKLLDNISEKYRELKAELVDVQKEKDELQIQRNNLRISDLTNQEGIEGLKKELDLEKEEHQRSKNAITELTKHLKTISEINGQQASTIQSLQKDSLNQSSHDTINFPNLLDKNSRAGSTADTKTFEEVQSLLTLKNSEVQSLLRSYQEAEELIHDQANTMEKYIQNQKSKLKRERTLSDKIEVLRHENQSLKREHAKIAQRLAEQMKEPSKYFCSQPAEFEGDSSTIATSQCNHLWALLTKYKLEKDQLLQKIHEQAMTIHDLTITEASSTSSLSLLSSSLSSSSTPQPRLNPQSIKC